MIVVYQGQPSGVLWYHPIVVRYTTYLASQLRPLDAQALASSISEPTIPAALRYAKYLHNEWELAQPSSGTTTDHHANRTRQRPPAVRRCARCESCVEPGRCRDQVNRSHFLSSLARESCAGRAGERPRIGRRDEDVSLASAAVLCIRVTVPRHCGDWAWSVAPCTQRFIVTSLAVPSHRASSVATALETR